MGSRRHVALLDAQQFEAVLRAHVRQSPSPGQASQFPDAGPLGHHPGAVEVKLHVQCHTLRDRGRSSLNTRLHGALIPQPGVYQSKSGHRLTDLRQPFGASDPDECLVDHDDALRLEALQHHGYPLTRRTDEGGDLVMGDPAHDHAGAGLLPP